MLFGFIFSFTMKSKEELNQASNHIDLEKLSVNS